MDAAVDNCKSIVEIDDSQMVLRRVFDESQTNQQSLSFDEMDAAVDDCKSIAEIDYSQMVGVSADSVFGSGEAPKVWKIRVRVKIF